MRRWGLRISPSISGVATASRLLPTNTFAAIIRALVDGLELEPGRAALARSLAGHIVAGVAGEEEVRAFREFCSSLG